MSDPADMKETGFVKKVEKMLDDEGYRVLRATIDFYDGNCPAITFGTIWKRVPVKMVECPDEQ